MDLSDITALLYAGIIDGDAWSAGLEALIDLVKAHHFVGVGASENGSFAAQSVDLWTARLDPQFHPVMLQGAADSTAAVATMTVGRAMPHQIMIPQEILNRSPYYNEVIRPIGGHHGIIARPFDGSYIAFCRSEQAGDYVNDNVAMVQHAMPTLQAALRLKRHFRLLEARVSSLEAAMDETDVGVILLDERGRPKHVNRLAEQILRAADGIDRGPTGLVGARESDTRRLRAAIATADGAPCFLPRPSLKRPLVARVVPVDGGATGRRLDLLGGGHVALFLRDPDSRFEQGHASISAAYGLTPREAELAALLARGLSVSMAADRLGISVGNARIHLKRIFQKTDTHSQADLIRLILNSRA